MKLDYSQQSRLPDARPPRRLHALTLHGKILVGFLSGTILIFVVGLTVAMVDRGELNPSGSDKTGRVPPLPDRTPPEVSFARRPLPDSFPRNTYRPRQREGHVSGSIDLGTFSAGRDLVYVDDPRVWWESDHDQGDTECDHTMHRALELPFRRLVELVAEAGGQLEVQDAYRPSGIHSPRSLHQEGRAIDLTCDQFPLEELAKLAWAAGFDWVYYESKAGGPHVHASVRRDHEDPGLPAPLSVRGE